MSVHGHERKLQTVAGSFMASCLNEWWWCRLVPFSIGSCLLWHTGILTPNMHERHQAELSTWLSVHPISTKSGLWHNSADMAHGRHYLINIFTISVMRIQFPVGGSGPARLPARHDLCNSPPCHTESWSGICELGFSGNDPGWIIFIEIEATLPRLLGQLMCQTWIR